MVPSGIRPALTIGLVLALTFPAPASAAARDASDPPRVSGPLVDLAPGECEDGGSLAPGSTRLEMCAWLYDLVPAETNALEDYGAYWIQIDVEPAQGTCVYGVDFGTSGPIEGRIVSSAPRTSGTGGETTVELTVDAEGAALAEGQIAQDLSLPKGRIRTHTDADAFAFRWKGKTAKKLVLAMGIQVANPFPPPVLTTWFESVGLLTGSCRTPVIRGGR